MSSLTRSIARHPLLYVMILPGIVFFVMFFIVPVLGTVIAFQDYNTFKGVLGSPWVGLKHFEQMFRYPDFLKIFMNTVSIGLLKLVIGFPLPIILALLLNELRLGLLRSTIQTSLFLPHFFSWVIVGQVVYGVLSPDAGLVNIVLQKVFGTPPIFFVTKERIIQPLIAIAEVWKESGYSSIVFLAALTAIDPQLYDSAAIDGARKMRTVWSITLPLLLPTMTIIFLLNIGSFLEVGFDPVYNLINPLVWSKGDIFDTYIYRVGIFQGKFSFTTAVGLFKSVVGFFLIIGGNTAAKRLTGYGFY